MGSTDPGPLNVGIDSDHLSRDVTDSPPPEEAIILFGKNHVTTCEDM